MTTNKMKRLSLLIFCSRHQTKKNHQIFKYIYCFISILPLSFFLFFICHVVECCCGLSGTCKSRARKKSQVRYGVRIQKILNQYRNPFKMKCPDLSWAFLAASGNGMRRYLEGCHGESAYQCPLCNKLFTNWMCFAYTLTGRLIRFKGRRWRNE